MIRGTINLKKIEGEFYQSRAMIKLYIPYIFDSIYYHCVFKWADSKTPIRKRKYQIVDIIKEIIIEQLVIKYLNSPVYDYKILTSDELKQHFIDRLYVGIHSVNLNDETIMDKEGFFKITIDIINHNKERDLRIQKIIDFLTSLGNFKMYM